MLCHNIAGNNYPHTAAKVNQLIIVLLHIRRLQVGYTVFFREKYRKSVRGKNK